MTAIAGVLLAVAAAQDAETLRAAWGAPSTVDPHRAATPSDARLIGALHEGLVTFAADGVTPVPGMAASWSKSDDGRTWTFALREAAWSTGDPVVAGDFVRAWRRAIDPGTGCRFRSLFRVFAGVSAWMDAAEADAILAVYEDQTDARRRELAARLGEIARARHADALRKRGLPEAADAAASRPEVPLGFDAKDDRTLVVRLERPVPYLLDLLGFVSFVPMSAGKGWPSNGPYLLHSREGAGLVLRSNPTYWDAAAAGRPARIEVTFLPGAAEGADWVTGDLLPDGDVKGAVRYATWGTYFLRVNVTRKPLDSVRLRRAIAGAIDRTKVAAAAGAGPASSLVPPGYPGYAAVSGPPFDKPEAMLALLQATGFDTTKFPRLELTAPDAPPFVEAAAAVRRELEATLGIDVRLRVLKAPAYFAALASGRFEVALGAWMGDAFDPVTFLEAWRTGDPANAGGWSNAGFDARLDRRDDRLKALAEAERILLEDGAVIPLFSAGDRMVLSERVQGLAPNPMNRFPLKHLSISPR